jgi:hypothetical protein
VDGEHTVSKSTVVGERLAIWNFAPRHIVFISVVEDVEEVGSWEGAVFSLLADEKNCDEGVCLSYCGRPPTSPIIPCREKAR